MENHIEHIKISCVIPTHGRPAFLQEAIESVLAQTFLPYEIVVVSDDGNSGSKAIVEDFSSKAEILISYVENATGEGGASSSRNLGASMAEGTHLAFLDDDDKWAPEYLSNVDALFRTRPTECVVTWLMMFRGEQHVPGLTMKPGLRARDAASMNPGFTGSNFVVERTVFFSIEGFDSNLRVINDGDFIYRYLSAGHTYLVNESFQVFQRKHASGQLTAASEMRAQGLEKYMSKHIATLRLSDRRYMRLAINRIRYHSANSTASRFRYLLIGIANSSPRSIAVSIRGWKQRPFWRVKAAQSGQV